MSDSDSELKTARIKEAVNLEMEAQSSSSNQIVAIKKSNNYRCVLCCLFPFRLCMNPNVLPDARGGMLPVSGKRVRRSSSIPESNPETEEMIRRVWHDQDEEDDISENSSQCNPDAHEIESHSLYSQEDSRHQLGSLDSSQLGSKINIDLHGSEVTLHLQESDFYLPSGRKESCGSDHDEVESHLLNSDACSETNLTVEENLAGELQSNIESLDEDNYDDEENDKDYDKIKVISTETIQKQNCMDILQTAEINFETNPEEFENTVDITINHASSKSQADGDTSLNSSNDTSLALSNEADTSLALSNEADTSLASTNDAETSVTLSYDANNDTTTSSASSEDTDSATNTDNSFEAVKDTSTNVYDSIYQDESTEASDCTVDNDVNDEVDVGLHRTIIAKKFDSPQLGTELHPVSEKRRRSLISRLKPTKSSTAKDSEEKESKEDNKKSLSRKGSFRERLQKKLHKEKYNKSSSPLGSPKASSSKMMLTPAKKSPKLDGRKSTTKNSALKSFKGRSLKRFSLLVGKQLLSAKKKEYKLINAFSPPPSQFCIGLPMVRVPKGRPDPFEAVTNVLYMKRNQH